MTEYEAGACNIGRAERRKRYALGAVGFLAAAAVAVLVFALGAPDYWLLATLLPLFGGFLGLLQGRASFCVGFALAGVTDTSDAGGHREAVDDQAAHRADRRRALELQAQALVYAAVVTVALYVAA